MLVGAPPVEADTGTGSHAGVAVLVEAPDKRREARVQREGVQVATPPCSQREAGLAVVVGKEAEHHPERVVVRGPQVEEACHSERLA